MGRRHEAPLLRWSSVIGRGAPLGRLLLLLLQLCRSVNRRRVLGDIASGGKMKSAWVVGQDGWCWTLLMCNIKITLWPHTFDRHASFIGL